MLYSGNGTRYEWVNTAYVYGVGQCSVLGTCVLLVDTELAVVAAVVGLLLIGVVSAVLLFVAAIAAVFTVVVEAIGVVVGTRAGARTIESCWDNTVLRWSAAALRCCCSSGTF